MSFLNKHAPESIDTVNTLMYVWGLFVCLFPKYALLKCPHLFEHLDCWTLAQQLRRCLRFEGFHTFHRTLGQDSVQPCRVCRPSLYQCSSPAVVPPLQRRGPRFHISDNNHSLRVSGTHMDSRSFSSRYTLAVWELEYHTCRRILPQHPALLDTADRSFCVCQCRSPFLVSEPGLPSSLAVPCGPVWLELDHSHYMAVFCRTPFLQVNHLCYFRTSHSSRSEIA